MNAKKYKKVIMLLVLCLILSVMVPMRMMHADAEDEMPDDDLSGSAVAVLPEETVETSEKPAENVEKAEETESEEETPVPSETAAPAESEDPEEDLSGSATAATNVTATPAPSPSESPAPAETEQPVSTPSPAVSASPAPTATPEPTANAVAADSQTARDIAYSQPALINRPTGVTPGSSSVIISQPSAVANPIIREDFRFYTVARKYAFAKEDLKIRVQMNDDGTPAGSLAQGGLCYVLKEEGNGWDYVESGKVRGFVQAELLQTGEEAEELLEQYQEEARKLAESKNTAYSGIESVAMTAETELDPMENEAFTYLKATVNPTVCTKIYALAKEDLPILEEGNPEAREIGSVKKGGLLYIITDRFNDWVYVESGDARGFVPKKSIKTGGVRKAVLTKGEDTFETAVTTVKPSENRAVYYTLTSIQSGVPVGKLRKSILDFAAQYIGNPYVWGGTSLENGADCSGFVTAVFRKFGFSRIVGNSCTGTLENCGRLIGGYEALDRARPGDIILYWWNGGGAGESDHVVIYAGKYKGQQEKRKPDRDPDRAGVHKHRTHRRPVHPPRPAHLHKPPAPDEEVERGDVDDSVEDAFRTEDRVLERHAHESGVGEHRREAQDGKRAPVAPRREPREEDERSVRSDDYDERLAEAPEHGGVERTLEDVDDEAGRDGEDQHVDDALHGRLVEQADAAAERAHRHQGEEHADLRRDCCEIMHSAYYTISRAATSVSRPSRACPCRSRS